MFRDTRQESKKLPISSPFDFSWEEQEVSNIFHEVEGYWRTDSFCQNSNNTRVSGKESVTPALSIWEENGQKKSGCHYQKKYFFFPIVRGKKIIHNEQK